MLGCVQRWFFTIVLVATAPAAAFANDWGMRDSNAKIPPSSIFQAVSTPAQEINTIAFFVISITAVIFLIVAGLLLISPAAGYGAALEEVRASKRDSRLAMLAELGPQGLADKRSANMLSPHADDASREWVRWNMSRIVPHGFM